MLSPRTEPASLGPLSSPAVSSPQPTAQIRPLALLVNNVLLAHGQAHVLASCQGPFAGRRGRGEQFRWRQTIPYEPEGLPSGPRRKSLQPLLQARPPSPHLPVCPPLLQGAGSRLHCATCDQSLRCQLPAPVFFSDGGFSCCQSRAFLPGHEVRAVTKPSLRRFLCLNLKHPSVKMGTC